MDKRKRLSRGDVLSFPGMTCCIEETIGFGSNAIVYRGWYRDRLQEQERHQVLIKELFPYDPEGGIWRGEDGSLHIEEGEALALYLLHRESFEAGNRIHLRLLESCPEDMGANLNSFAYRNTLYTILGYSGGRTLEAELAKAGLPDLRRCVQLMLMLLDALAAFHDSGYLHLDISPDNVLILGQGTRERVLLIDYNSATPMDACERSYLSCKEGYSAPELQSALEDLDAIGAASDLYSVAAVFYRCLMGRAMTLEESIRSVPPDAADSPCLKDMPQTVAAQVKFILRKGLDILAEDRFQTIGEMRTAFEELMDRIDCVGVTHWALWESGRRSMQALVAENPSLRYIKDEEGLYPIRLEREGQSIPMQDYLEEMMSPQGTSRLILSAGGMGKTTLLMRTALMYGRRYLPGQPAAFYISLSGWREGNTQYIRSRMLASLRFKPGSNTFDSALHELEQLLGRTIAGKKALPAVLLLLDGLNEVRGDIAPLIQEIHQLDGMAGVRILATSRSELPALQMDTSRMFSLTREDVTRAAAKQGVLLPKSEDMLRLMKTPLILSIYLKASMGSQQMDIKSQDDLMRAYLQSLQMKEVQRLPEHSPQRWQLEAALGYVLPAIAAAMMAAKRPPADEALLKVVERCHRVLSSRLLQQAFPQWIGRSREILGETQSAEAWYGLMVHDLLWQRLGLLTRDEAGGYSVFHQTVAEYLERQNRENEVRIRKRRRTRTALAALASSLALAAGFGVYAACFMVTPYAEAEVEYVLSEGRKIYDWFMQSHAEVQALLACTDQDAEAFEAQYERTRGILRGYGRLDDGTWHRDAPTLYPSGDEMKSDAMQIYRIAIQERKVVSWSGEALDGEGILALYSHFWDRQRYYTEIFLPELKAWYYDSGSDHEKKASWMMSSPGQYLEAAQEMVRCDALLCELLYRIYLSGHMDNADLAKLVAQLDDALDRATLSEIREDADKAGTSRVSLETALRHAEEARGAWNNLMSEYRNIQQRIRRL